MKKLAYILIFMLALSPVKTYARPLVADLNPRKIDITHDFLGTDILIYGVRNDAGSIVVAIHGPEKNYLVREKKRVAGIWINGDSLKFENVPSFYSMAATGDLEKIRNDNLLEKLNIGIDNQKLVPIGKNAKELDVSQFKNALKNHFEGKKLFNAQPQEITFWGETLFRTMIDFPKNVLPGVYNVDVYLFNDGLLTSVQSTPLIVDKVGFEAFVYDFAHKHNALYGLICVSIAFICGFAARFLFARH